MSNFEKLLEKFYRKPIPLDITYLELNRKAKHYGFEVLLNKGKGSHRKLVHKATGAILIVPYAGKHVMDTYIGKLKDLIIEIGGD